MIYEWHIILFFLLVLRHGIILYFITALRGVLGFTGMIALSVACSLFAFPVEVSVPPAAQNYDVIYLSLREVTIGLLIGVPLGLVFEIIPFVGRLIDTFRGAQFAEQLAPEMGPRDSQLESYGGFFTLWIFFQGEYAGRFVELLVKANEAFPIYSVLAQNPSQSIFDIELSTFQEFLSSFFSICLIVALPLIIFSLATELSLSVLQKLCARFQVGLELTLGRALLGVLFMIFLINWSTAAPENLHNLAITGFNFLEHVTDVDASRPLN